MADSEPPKRSELAEQRTDFAEDRTALANERTFASWMRTGMACVGLGLAFHAVFGKLQPDWVPRAIASLFLVVGGVIIMLARARAAQTLKRLNTHSAKPFPGRGMQIVALLMASAVVILLVAVWRLDWRP